MNKEQEIAKLREKLQLTQEEAEQLWKDDHDDIETDEMKEMAVKAKKLKPKGKQGVSAYGQKRTRTIKENPAKRRIMRFMEIGCNDFLKVFSEKPCDMVNPERQIDFEHQGIEYSITLTAHRKKKE